MMKLWYISSFFRMKSRIENDKNIYNDKRCEDQEGRCVGEIDYIEREG